MYNKTLG